MNKLTWWDLYKRFTREYPKVKVADYRPYVEGFLPTGRPGIIIWLKNGDVLVYIPKHIEPPGGSKMDEDRDYEHAVEQLEHNMTFEPTYNPEDDSM